MFKNFFKKRMSENQTPNETPATTPETPAHAESTLKEHVTIRPEDVGEIPKEILETPPPAPAPPVTTPPAAPEAEAPTGKVLTMREFVSKFTPVNVFGESLPALTWEDFNNPGIMIGLIGTGKTTALAAAHQQKCWTVTKRPDGKLAIEAGMNSADQSKIGYLATQQPWTGLEVTVAQ